ncbi:MAG: class I SAM-dependent methyltransferase [Spirochaetaceae bacterium]|nr:class I SAM-dependent methyltransferase [Spirochaetaceae bacterium]
MAIKDEQIVFFENRISKRFKHLKKWAIRENIGAFRLYDRDIPEIPLRLDFYSDKNPKEAQGENRFATLTLFQRPYEKDDEEKWFAEMKKSMTETLEIPEENIFSKIRSKKRGADQYEKFSSAAKEIVVSEGDARFLINLSDYLDTGLFFDLRLLRQRLRSEATGKRILNLFCYTGSFSVFAALGGCKKVTSVDLSNNYISWAKRNFHLNGIKDAVGDFVSGDVLEFLQEKSSQKYDIIILDPPTFSNSKRTDTVLDLNRDWPELLKLCEKKLASGGKIYFATNSKKLRFETEMVSETLQVKEISQRLISPDFEKRRIPQVWEIIS